MLDKNINDYKVLIINGVSDYDDIVDGNTDFLGYGEELVNHVTNLVEYGRQKYPNINAFKHMDDKTWIFTPLCLLTMLNNVVYLNVFDKKSGKFGLLYLPNNISEKQKIILFDLARDLSKVNVEIAYNLQFKDDGDVTYEEFDAINGQEFEKKLNDFFSLHKNKKPRNEVHP